MPPKAVGNAEQTSRVRKRSASAPVRARQDKVADFDFDPAISSAVERRGSAAKRRVEPDGPLSPEMLSKIHRYWQAANYLTVGQIYLSDNPLLREPLKAAHIKPRLLGHWGTSAGQNFIYVHLNRLIKEHEAEVIYISGPGPSLNAHSYLEGTYSEVHPEVTQDAYGMRLLFRSSLRRAACRVIVGRTSRTRCTKEVSSAIRCSMPLGRHSIIRS